MHGRLLDKTKAKVVQLHTGGMCHVEFRHDQTARRTWHEDVDIAILENVGNLLCPAEFDTEE